MKENPVTVIRKRHQLNKLEFIQKVGMSWQGFYNIERGKIISLQQRTLQRIEKAFNIDPKQLQIDYLEWKIEQLSKKTGGLVEN